MQKQYVSTTLTLTAKKKLDRMDILEIEQALNDTPPLEKDGKKVYLRFHFTACSD